MCWGWLAEFADLVVRFFGAFFRPGLEALRSFKLSALRFAAHSLDSGWTGTRPSTQRLGIPPKE